MPPTSPPSSPGPAQTLDEALIYWDMTGGRGGSVTTLDDRLAEIFTRYAPDYPASHAMRRADPALIDTVHVIQTRMVLASTRLEFLGGFVGKVRVCGATSRSCGQRIGYELHRSGLGAHV